MSFLLRLLILTPTIATAASKVAPVAARTPLVEIEDHPQIVRLADDGRVLIDFGQATFGYLEYRPKNGVARPALSAWLGEKGNDDGTVDRKPGGTIRAQRIESAAGDGPAIFEPTWKPMYENWIENPPGIREIMPFRFAEIEGLDRLPDTSEIVRITRHTAFNDDASSFRSDKQDLNEVWEFCKTSIKLTTFLGLYVDGDRERKPYEADAYINQLCHYGVEDHYLTGRLTHEHLLEYPTWPMEWRQHAVLMAWVDYLYSGCDASIRNHYDTLVGRLMLERRRDDGLFLGSNDRPIRDIIDWPAGERDGYDMAPLVKTVTSAFNAHSLNLMARIATALGKSEDSARFSRMHQETTAAIREKLLCSERGIFIDGIDHKTGKQSPHASLHANMFPLAFGLVAEDDVPAVATFIRSRGMACSVYGAQFLLDALYDAGEAQHALDLMTATHDRGWIHMFRTVGSTIALEAWDMKYKPNLDWNHAWGAVPANTIPRKLMGIEPIAPGFTRFRVRPQIASLKEAAIRAPSPRGPIDLKVTREGSIWSATLVVPAGTVAEVHVPGKLDGNVEIRRDGTAVAPNPLRVENGSRVFEATPGSWTFLAE
ncbi:MAG: alpha-L-rhamnosidase C-terminal domain-containing protein [Luteolibacter sp.]